MIDNDDDDDSEEEEEYDDDSEEEKREEFICFCCQCFSEFDCLFPEEGNARYDYFTSDFDGIRICCRTKHLIPFATLIADINIAIVMHIVIKKIHWTRKLCCFFFFFFLLLFFYLSLETVKYMYMYCTNKLTAFTDKQFPVNNGCDESKTRGHFINNPILSSDTMA